MARIYFQHFVFKRMPLSVMGMMPGRPGLLSSATSKTVFRRLTYSVANPLCLKLTTKLTTLAPDIVQAILNSEEPDGLSLGRLVKAFPMDWQEQRGCLGLVQKGWDLLALLKPENKSSILIIVYTYY